MLRIIYEVLDVVEKSNILFFFPSKQWSVFCLVGISRGFERSSISSGNFKFSEKMLFTDSERGKFLNTSLKIKEKEYRGTGNSLPVGYLTVLLPDICIKHFIYACFWRWSQSFFNINFSLLLIKAEVL